MKHPLYAAREIADAILQDPIAARQVKEYINPDSLRLLLDIDMKSRDLLDELRHRMMPMQPEERRAYELIEDILEGGS